MTVEAKPSSLKNSLLYSCSYSHSANSRRRRLSQILRYRLASCWTLAAGEFICIVWVAVRPPSSWNGQSSFSIDWALVQPQVARLTRVCTYDRAGYAWSERGPATGSVEQTTDDLHLLLRTAGVHPPYILVGHSIGGLYVQGYQRRYPREVVGTCAD